MGLFANTREKQLIAERDEWREIAQKAIVAAENLRDTLRNFERLNKEVTALAHDAHMQMLEGPDPHDPR